MLFLSVLFEIVSATIPPGNGSLGWYHDDLSFPSTFTVSSTAVPEPAEAPALAVLFGITAALSRRTMRLHEQRSRR